ncbi:heat stress transcription factor A-2-like [Lycium barbarum]|uniref:heat stress transcription factor A-2-like n=1 Tax=Lycium barbarum TaxID=112863 RepID=UPI00293EE8FB|nr:heat stress transcription factor A-2-like [Lycium barbarum]
MAFNNISQSFAGENEHGCGDGAKFLREPGIPPFITKTYAMVEDPNTNSMISWSPSGTSFVICDHIRFSFELLPKYFKHTNMSSFIYQLNNYGFKKIGLQKWEFENYWFQAGKKHLLTNIKRRDRNLKVQKDFNQQTYYYGVEEELRSQRDLNDTLKSEIEKLKERQDDFANGIASLKEYLENSESESRKLLCFLAKAVKQVEIKSGTKRVVEVRDVIAKKHRAEDTAGSSSNSSEKKNMDDFSVVKLVHDIVKKPKIDGGSE